MPCKFPYQGMRAFRNKVGSNRVWFYGPPALKKRLKHLNILISTLNDVVNEQLNNKWVHETFTELTQAEIHEYIKNLPQTADLEN